MKKLSLIILGVLAIVVAIFLLVKFRQIKTGDNLTADFSQLGQGFKIEQWHLIGKCGNIEIWQDRTELLLAAVKNKTALFLFSDVGDTASLIAFHNGKIQSDHRWDSITNKFLTIRYANIDQTNWMIFDRNNDGINDYRIIPSQKIIEQFIGGSWIRKEQRNEMQQP